MKGLFLPESIFDFFKCFSLSLISHSLSQWLAHQKTCPQCRERCQPRSVLKLFIDDSNDSLQTGDNNILDPKELKVIKLCIIL